MAPLAGKEAGLFKSLIKLYEGKQNKKGIKVADAILRKAPEHGETLAMKALMLSQQGPDRKEEAYELVRKGVKADLRSHLVWHVYGWVGRSGAGGGQQVQGLQLQGGCTDDGCRGSAISCGCRTCGHATHACVRWLRAGMLACAWCVPRTGSPGSACMARCLCCVAVQACRGMPPAFGLVRRAVCLPRAAFQRSSSPALGATNARMHPPCLMPLAASCTARTATTRRPSSAT